jgi:hypothetical protein
MAVADGTQNLDAIDPREREIQEYDVGLASFYEREPFLAVRGDIDIMTLALEQTREHEADVGFVIDDEDRSPPTRISGRRAAAP